MTHPLDHHPILRMNGAGNEILVLDLRGRNHILSPQEARAIGAEPGLHFDQLMAVHDPLTPDTDAFMRIYNLDGSQSGACGNGTRCVALALAKNGKTSLRLETFAGHITTVRDAPTVFTVDMGAPRFAWQDIPLAKPHDTRHVDLTPVVPGAPQQFSAVNVGNPHAIFFVDDVSIINIEKLGPLIEHHALFPQRVNVSFVQILSPEDILLRVWERGVGLTKACGSAACATLTAAARSGLTQRTARLRLPGGDLMISWRQDDHIMMTGPVEFEFEKILDSRIFMNGAV